MCSQTEKDYAHTRWQRILQLVEQISGKIVGLMIKASKLPNFYIKTY